MIFIQKQLQKFIDIPFKEQVFSGAQNPRLWANRMRIGHDDLEQFSLKMEDIPDSGMDRHMVRAICRDPARHVLIGYICAMAWGGQGVGASVGSAKKSWAARAALVPVLKELRCGTLTRAQAYDLFCGDGEISGLGPSFFTKLIFFFSRDPDCYIMDQWTAKSINYLTGETVVLMSRHWPSRKNCGENFSRYCELVDELVVLLSLRDQINTGEQVEQRLFSNGGREKIRGEWRAVVTTAFIRKEKLPVAPLDSPTAD